ncbi:MAG: Rpn family recombination-promoting nuclease/putative transposase [Tannerellaceae bacterium]|nr:Rpn family recombination-promoting nuclease/putative transposase [Tannerellaceae bacterium]
MEQVPANPLQKYAIADVRCRDNKGRQFIVEMQMIWNSIFNSRMVFKAGRREMCPAFSVLFTEPGFLPGKRRDCGGRRWFCIAGWRR